MNNQIVKINGLKEIEGMKFHDIEGGFGEDKKAMLAKEIATIHGRELKDINRNINKNITRFKHGIDILDLKGTEFEVILNHHGIYNQNAINRSENIYLLSERGYSKLLKILEDDVAWEQYEKLVDGYFNMRKELSPKQLLELQFNFTKDVEEKVEKIDTRVSRVEDYIENEELSTSQQKKLTKLVNWVVVPLLGGKKSNAYVPLSKKVFADLYKQIHREFGVDSICEIKKVDFELAKKAVNDYKLPKALKDEIDTLNNQVNFEEVI